MRATTYTDRVVENTLGSIIYHVFVIVPGQGLAINFFVGGKVTIIIYRTRTYDMGIFLQDGLLNGGE